ncbi:MAG: hypothetical protein EWV84_03570 [Microcystis sp. M_QC_C_20170808_M3Col]|nr:MAG: hypothetical protein EWV84_03570 [Microcystis sp. M_QC_C_20170808_M3Col]
MTKSTVITTIGFAAKSFSVVAGCGVWGFTSFEVANYLIFREKVPKFPPDHSHIQYFLIDKSHGTDASIGENFQ